MIRVGILGTGNIGTDLLLKVLRTNFLIPTIFSGRRMDSDGIRVAQNHNVPITDKGINYFIENPNVCDIVFDCTSAIDAEQHAKIFAEQGVRVIDMTPAKIGPLCVPSINGDVISTSGNVNMITCGGQASLPLLKLIADNCDSLEYVEVVSQIASKSAGMATRLNVDNYIHTTETAIIQFTNAKRCKVILNLNPAEPCVDMQTTMFIKFTNLNYEKLSEQIYKKIKELRTYIPHYELTIPPVINDDILILSVRVKGVGDYLPEYAGNLDIINCAAIEIAKRFI